MKIRLIFFLVVLYNILFVSCNYFQGGTPSDIYLADSLDSLNRPRLPLPDRELVKISLIEDASMKAGFVIIRMIIDANGKITLPVVERSLGAVEDSAALKRIRALPDFIPGTIKGRPVKVVYYLPFIFNPSGSNPTR